MAREVEVMYSTGTVYREVIAHACEGTTVFPKDSHGFRPL